MVYQDAISAHVQRLIHDGYGDMTAPLTPDEFVATRLTCPHQGCGWTLDTEWRSNLGLRTTRVRGYTDIEHLDPTLFP